MQILSVHTPRIKLYRSKMSLVPSKDMIKVDSWVCKSFLNFIMMKTHKHLGSQAARISFKFLQPFFKPINIYICITTFIIFLYIIYICGYLFGFPCYIKALLPLKTCMAYRSLVLAHSVSKEDCTYVYIYMHIYIFRYAFDKVLFEYGLMALYILNVSRYHQVLLSRHTQLC
jgi:hypothetical protein